MSKWIKEGVPAFVVVGRINMGKSAVLATLLEVDDDRIIRVSPTPGETTHCHVLPVVFDERELVRFIDTPGFSRPLEAMRAIQELHGEGSPDLGTVGRFVRERGEAFDDEARLLEPIVEGAGILYVIDPGKPLRDAFVAEMEILRWTGRPRMALLNQKGEEAPHLEEWRNRLGSYFNLIRTFNAHHARFEERKHLMRALLDIDESNRPMLEEAIGLIEEEWAERREEAADVILDMLRKALALRVEGRLDEEQRHSERKRERLVKDLTRRYVEKVRRIEGRSYERLLKIYRHHLMTVEDDAPAYEGIDLEAAETWKKWGLSRGQMTVAASVAGAAGGALVDVGTGGLTHGIGTVVGAVGGAAAAFFKGADLPELGVDPRRGMKISSGSGRTLVIGPPRNVNFPWILLDSALHHYLAISRRAHGKREETVIAGRGGESVVRGWPPGRRAAFAKWFGGCLKGTPDPHREQTAFDELVRALEEAERADPAMRSAPAGEP